MSLDRMWGCVMVGSAGQALTSAISVSVFFPPCSLNWASTLVSPHHPCKLCIPASSPADHQLLCNFRVGSWRSASITLIFPQCRATACVRIMDFTEIYKHTASLVAFSPGAQFILTAVQDRLVIRRADSFQITRTWQLDPPSDALPSHAGRQDPRHTTQPPASWISHAGWSSDSEYVLAASAKAGVVSVFKLRDESWHASIEAGAEGLAKAEWAPDGRSILCFSEWGVSGSAASIVSSHV